MSAASPGFLQGLYCDDEAVVLINRTNQRTIATCVKPALDRKSRRTGLLGHSSLASDEGLLLAPCQAIHTYFMRFAIDVAFISREGQVVRVLHGLKPWRMAFARRAGCVLETAAGTLQRAGLTVGDYVTVTRATSGVTAN